MLTVFAFGRNYIVCFRSYSSRRRIILFQVILKRKKTYYYMCQVNYTFLSWRDEHACASYPNNQERGNAMDFALGGLALDALIGLWIMNGRHNKILMLCSVRTGPPFGGVMYCQFVGKQLPFSSWPAWLSATDVSYCSYPSYVFPWNAKILMFDILLVLQVLQLLVL